MPEFTQRQVRKYELSNGNEAYELKVRMLNWANQFSIHIFFDNNNYPGRDTGYECLLAVGSVASTPISGPAGLGELLQLHNSRKDWLFGHICYDYKNELEAKLTSAHAPRTGFPSLHFFVPETVCYINKAKGEFTIESFTDPAIIYGQLIAAEYQAAPLPKIEFTRVVGKEAYLQTIHSLRRHIADGDCYEINYCTEGFCEGAAVEPLSVFNALNAISPAPFASFYRLNDLYMMCASPERYIKKEGRKVLSQPIKGTARRDKDAAKDAAIKSALLADIKERAENVMIVDLVRNDLARACDVGSVQVEELFGIYTYPQVHHMISTVSGQLKEGLPFTDAIRYSFPMGSMTGAPKHKVMQLIEHYEQSRRELFSGTVGYITPDGDFDFNVVIRSLFYNASTQYLAYQTGGAITYDSVPEQEWEEMRLKAWALERIFT